MHQLTTKKNIRQEVLYVLGYVLTQRLLVNWDTLKTFNLTETFTVYFNVYNIPENATDCCHPHWGKAAVTMTIWHSGMYEEMWKHGAWGSKKMLGWQHNYRKGFFLSPPFQGVYKGVGLEHYSCTGSCMRSLSEKRRRRKSWTSSSFSGPPMFIMRIPVLGFLSQAQCRH